MKKEKIGVVHGRFQILHNGHVDDLILHAFEECEKVIIGICNPDPDLTRFDDANPHRSEEINNPFSYWERLEMIRDTLIDIGISRDRFEIVPFPINFPEKIKYYAPPDAIYFIDIYDEWGKKKEKVLAKLGLDVRSREVKKIISGSEIRSMIVLGNNKWKEYVPPAAVRLLEEGLIQKIKPN